MRSARRDPEEVALALRCIRECLFDRQRGARLVLRPDVDDVERVRRRLDLAQIELRNLADRLQNRVQLPAEPPELLLGQLEPGEPGYVHNLCSIDRHLPILPRGQKKRPPFGGRFGFRFRKVLDRLDVHGLQALVALLDIELNALPLGQRAVALHRDLRVVDEDVLSTLTLDEAVALLVREPLDGALSQLTTPFSNKTNDGPGTEPSAYI